MGHETCEISKAFYFRLQEPTTKSLFSSWQFGVCFFRIVFCIYIHVLIRIAYTSLEKLHIHIQRCNPIRYYFKILLSFCKHVTYNVIKYWNIVLIYCLSLEKDVCIYNLKEKCFILAPGFRGLFRIAWLQGMNTIAEGYNGKKSPAQTKYWSKN